MSKTFERIKKLGYNLDMSKTFERIKELVAQREIKSMWFGVFLKVHFLLL
jgi:hypothetical protein